MNRIFLTLALLSTTGCTGKEPTQPDSQWSHHRGDSKEDRWGTKHAGTSANAYPYEDYVGLSYPDGRSCRLQHFQPEPETMEQEQAFYRLKKWKTRVGSSSGAGDFKVLTSPALAESEIVDYCPLHGRTRWSNDLVHGVTTWTDASGRLDGWIYEATTDRGTHSQNYEGFIDELFAPYGAVMITRFAFPDARKLAEERVVNDQVMDIYENNPCQLHLSHYLADDWISLEDVEVELSTGETAGVTFTPSTIIESDVIGTPAQVTVEWGGNGTARSAACSIEEESQDPEQEERQSFCEEFCQDMTFYDPSEYEQCVEECLETNSISCEVEFEDIPGIGSCRPGAGLFMAAPIQTPSKGGRNMLIPLEVYQGFPGAAAVVTGGPDDLKIHARLDSGSWDFKRSELEGVPFPLGLAYTDKDIGSTMTLSWGCDSSVAVDIPEEPTWLVEDVYGDTDILVAETVIPHTNHDTGEKEYLPALRYQVLGRRDIVTIPAGLTHTISDMEVQWTDRTLFIDGQPHSSRQVR